MSGSFLDMDNPVATPRSYPVDADILGVMAADDLPERLRPLAVDIGAGSALSSPDMLLQDLVNLRAGSSFERQVSGPATAALLGGSVSSQGDLDASGVAFGTGGFLGFVSFVLPAALLLPGGGMYVAYRLFRLARDLAALRRYARVSRAAPHVATIVAMSDHELTRDEVRLLRDLLRGRVGSPAERQALLLKELDISAKRTEAFDALAELDIEDDDWPQLLAIAIATAHADHDYSDEEREAIAELRRFTSFTEPEFSRIAADAEHEYLTQCHLGEAMVRSCYQVARGHNDAPPEDARALLDVVLSAAVPSDVERAILVEELRDADGPTAVSLDELTRGTSHDRPTLFGRLRGALPEDEQRVRRFGETLSLFLATLEQWRGWVVRGCREQLVDIGSTYGLREKRLLRSLDKAHRNTESLRNDWLRPRPWQSTAGQALDVELEEFEAPDGGFAVRGLAAGRFLFHRGETRWEWRSSSTHFDDFCDSDLDLDVERAEIVVKTDDTTFELLRITIDAHSSRRRIARIDPDGDT